MFNFYFEIKKEIVKKFIERKFHYRNILLENLLKFSVDNCDTDQNLAQIAFGVMFI